jgi:hypothetical protein
MASIILRYVSSIPNLLRMFFIIKEGCPSADEWIKEMYYFYTVEYYLIIKI